MLKTGPRVSLGFCMFLPCPLPHKVELWSLDKKSRKKFKGNAWKRSCTVLFWNTVFLRSCHVVYVLYTFYIPCILLHCVKFKEAFIWFKMQEMTDTCGFFIERRHSLLTDSELKPVSNLTVSINIFSKIYRQNVFEESSLLCQSVIT